MACRVWACLKQLPQVPFPKSFCFWNPWGDPCRASGWFWCFQQLLAPRSSYSSPPSVCQVFFWGILALLPVKALGILPFSSGSVSSPVGACRGQAERILTPRQRLAQRRDSSSRRLHKSHLPPRWGVSVTIRSWYTIHFWFLIQTSLDPRKRSATFKRIWIIFTVHAAMYESSRCPWNVSSLFVRSGRSFVLFFAKSKIYSAAWRW